MIRSVASKVMWVGRATVFLVGLAVILALIFGVLSRATAHSGSAGLFHLNHNNPVSALSTLTGTLTGAVLKVDNNGTGPALSLEANAGNAPLSVNSTAGKATNLNADKLDGADSAAYQKRVSGECPAGESIRAIAADGSTVTCEADDQGSGGGTIASTHTFVGRIPEIPPSLGNWVFAGPQATVTTTASQRMFGVAEAAMALESPYPENFDYGLCYEPAGGTITNFVGNNYMTGELTTTRVSWGGSAAVTPGAGTWRVGFCVRSWVTISDNDFVNGWVQVLNPSSGASAAAPKAGAAGTPARESAAPAEAAAPEPAAPPAGTATAAPDAASVPPR
jgi:hypothetical protein